MTQITEDKQLRSSVQQLGDLLEKVQTISDPAARDITADIIQKMMDFHGAGLERIMEHIADAGELGESIIKQLGEDETVSGLLLLYDMHPLPLDVRVHEALESARPYLASHGGNVELLEITDDGVVHLQLQGSCHGCPSSAMTLKDSIERAIYEKAPDVTAIHVAGIEEPPKPTRVDGFVSVEQLIAGTSKSHGRLARGLVREETTGETPVGR